MDIEQEQFRELSKTSGKVRFEAEGTAEEKEYSSDNFINSAGTMGYALVVVEGKPDFILVSRSERGIVLTMPGDQTGPSPLPIEGYAAISTVRSGSPLSEFYDAHIRALAGDKPLADRPWLEREVPVLPQRALDVAMKIFSVVCEQMDKLMAGMGSAMGEMMEGMGKAMGEALKGVGEAMGGALEGVSETPVAPATGKARPKALRPKKAKKTAPAGKKDGPTRKAGPKGKARPGKKKASRAGRARPRKR